MIWQVNKTRTIIRWYWMSRVTEFNQNVVDRSVCDVTVDGMWIEPCYRTAMTYSLFVRALHELYEAEWLVWFDKTVVIWFKDEWCGVLWCGVKVWCCVVWCEGVVWCGVTCSGSATVSFCITACTSMFDIGKLSFRSAVPRSVLPHSAPPCPVLCCYALCSS